MLKYDNCFVVDQDGTKGGLMLLWSSSIKLSILSYSKGHIDCLIEHLSSFFYFTGFYGNPKLDVHYLSWNLLNNIASTHTNPQFG